MLFAAICVNAQTGNYCDKTKENCYQLKDGNKVSLIIPLKDEYKQLKIQPTPKNIQLSGTYTNVGNNFSIDIKEMDKNSSTFLNKAIDMGIEKKISELCAQYVSNGKPNKGKIYPRTQQGADQCKKDVKQDQETKVAMQEMKTVILEAFLKKQNFVLIGNSLHELDKNCRSIDMYTKEGAAASVFFDENKQFCFNGVPYDKCNGKVYEPNERKCENNILLAKCKGEWYNPAGQYCFKDAVKDKELTDSRDGKKYRTAKIGNQTWMGENLNYHGKDGYLGLCKDKKPENCEIYGRDYDWAEAMAIDEKFNENEWNGSNVMHQGVCPDGWYLPNVKDWEIFLKSVGNDKKKLQIVLEQDESECKYKSEDSRGRPIEVDDCLKNEFGFSAIAGSSWWSANNVNKEGKYSMRYEEEERKDSYLAIGRRKTELSSVRCLKETDEMKAAAEAAKEKTNQEAKAKDILLKKLDAWSKNIGGSGNNYNWNQAKELCSKQGMRLPTNEEWEIMAKDLKENEFLFDLFEDVGDWWSATSVKNDNASAYIWRIFGGYGDPRSLIMSDNHKEFGKINVRCIKPAAK
jgi:uncharacterized protein (TIGR02145 family)